MKIPRDTCGDLGGYFRHLIPGQSMWDLWWNNWHWVSGFFTRVVRFSPVCIVPPLLHTRSLASRRRCIILTVDSIVKHTHLHARLFHRTNSFIVTILGRNLIAGFGFSVFSVSIQLRQLQCSVLCVFGYICVYTEISSGL